MPVSVKDIVYEFAKDMHRLFGKDMSRVMIPMQEVIIQKTRILM